MPHQEPNHTPSPSTMPPLPEIIPQPVVAVNRTTPSSMSSIVSQLTSSTYYNATEDEMMKSLLRQVYTAEVQSKCKFLQDHILYCYNDEDQKHISQVILNGIGVDPSLPREAREDKWARLSPHVKNMMQEHRNKLVQRLKHKLMGGKYLCGSMIYWSVISTRSY